MYAVIKTGNHQYRVKEGDKIKVEKLAGKAGEQVVFNDVLMLKDENGEIQTLNTLENSVVEGTISEQTRNKKIIVFKYKRRKGYKKQQGHKQQQTVVEINKIKS